MTIKWKQQDQYTGFGYFRVGDEVGTVEKGIPDQVVENWISAGFAEEIGEPVLKEAAPVMKGKAKKAMEVKHG